VPAIVDVMQRHYVHGVKPRKAKDGVDDKRYALIFRDGQEMKTAKDSGCAVSSLNPDPKKELIFGRHSKLFDGCIFRRREMLLCGAHR